VPPEQPLGNGSGVLVRPVFRLVVSLPCQP
jgi:hypothetical protein